MAWHRPGDKPLFEPMMVSLLTHICVTRPQWVNYTKFLGCQHPVYEDNFSSSQRTPHSSSSLASYGVSTLRIWVEIEHVIALHCISISRIILCFFVIKNYHDILRVHNIFVILFLNYIICCYCCPHIIGFCWCCTMLCHVLMLYRK